MIGAGIKLPVGSRKDFSYFSETQSRIIVSISQENKNEFEKLLHSVNQYFIEIGKTGGLHLKINSDIDVSLNELADLYFNTIPRIMNGER